MTSQGDLSLVILSLGGKVGFEESFAISEFLCVLHWRSKNLFEGHVIGHWSGSLGQWSLAETFPVIHYADSCNL